MALNRSDIDKYYEVLTQYLPDTGEGDTMATQLATAVDRIVYRWFNDGETIWTDECQPFADWLWQNIDGIDAVIDDMNQYMFVGFPYIKDWTFRGIYENCLKKILDIATDRDLLNDLDSRPKEGSVFDSQGVALDVMETEFEDKDDYYGDDSLRYDDNLASEDYF